MSMFNEVFNNGLVSAILDIGGKMLDKTKGREIVQFYLKERGLEGDANDFAKVYLETIVDLRLERVLPNILNFYREETYYSAVYKHFYSRDTPYCDVPPEEVLEEVDRLSKKPEYQDIKADWRYETQHFWRIFKKNIHESRTVKEVELHQIIRDLQNQCSDINQRLDSFLSEMKELRKEDIQMHNKTYHIGEINKAVFREIENSVININIGNAIYNIEQIATANFDSYLKNIVDKAKQLNPTSINKVNNSTLTAQENVITGNNNTVAHEINHHYHQTPIADNTRPKQLNQISKPMPQQVIGRLDDVETVRRLLTANNTLVIVNGLGGIGKTVLSHYYWQQYQAEYKHLIWLSAADDLESALLFDSLLHRNLQLTDTIAPYLEAIKAANNADAKQNALDCIYQSLAELGKPCLLIIDNAEEQHQQTIKQWATDFPNFHLLISSRHQMDDVDTHYLGTLHPTDAIDLFYFYNKQIPKNADNDALIARVCELAGYHTLAIELLAKTLSNRHDLNLKQLADELSQQIVYLKKKAQISTNYTQTKDYIDGVLEFSFDLSTLQDNANALDLLLQLSVLPSTGIKADHLRQMLYIAEAEVETHEATKQKLIQMGWVQYEYADAHEYSCHTLIQEIVRHKLQANASNCAYIISFLIGKIEEIGKINPLQAAIWLPYCDSILQKISDENEVIAALANNAASIYHYMVDFPQSLAYYNKALAIWEKVLPADHPDLARSYYNLGNVYYGMGNFPQSLAYHHKAIAIFEKVLPADHPHLANSYHNLGVVYGNMSDFLQSLAYYNKALAIREKVLPADHPDLANIYHNLGVVYDDMGDFPQSLAYYNKAITIWGKVLPADHPHLASSYNNLGIVYDAMGDFPQSLAYHHKALAIREKVLPADHPDLANSYHNAALVYYKLSDWENAIAFAQKALEIWTKALPSKLPNRKKSIDGMESIIAEATKRKQ